MMLFFSESNVLPQHGALRRGWLKLRLYLRRLAAIGAGAVELRGFFGAWTRFLGRLTRFFSWLENKLRQGWYRLYRAGNARLERFFDWLHRHDALRWRLYDDLLHFQSRLHHQHRSRFGPCVLMLCAVILIISGCYFGLGFEVRLDGESLGYVESPEEIRAVVERVEKRVSAYQGSLYNLDANFTYTLRYLDRTRLVDESALEDRLFASVGDQERKYLLVVDGDAVGASTSQEALQSMLRRIILASSPDATTVNTRFVNDIEIRPTSGAGYSLMSIGEMEALLTQNKQETQTYTIRSGDTVSAIGLRYGMKISEIKALNPGLDEARIHVGQTLTLSAAVPYLSVQQTVTKTYQESIPFETVIEYDDTMYKTKSRMRVQGANGLADVVADVTYVNGTETGRDILSYTVVREPVTAVKVVGTKELPRTAATGSFVKPSGGRYSSGFGRRANLGDYHTGVDFAGRIGTSIWASDGGTVIWAGRKGNYGNLVIINHGNGYVTYFAHCSKLLVSKGDKVAKYDVIAKVGNTGRVTGPHLHFEIRKNGQAVNPLNYIGK